MFQKKAFSASGTRQVLVLVEILKENFIPRRKLSQKYFSSSGRKSAQQLSKSFPSCCKENKAFRTSGRKLTNLHKENFKNFSKEAFYARDSKLWQKDYQVSRRKLSFSAYGELSRFMRGIFFSFWKQAFSASWSKIFQPLKWIFPALWKETFQAAGRNLSHHRKDSFPSF